MVDKALFSHESDDWCTPRDKFNEWAKVFNFKVDAAASNDNKLCEIHYGPGSEFNIDALSCEWKRDLLHFCNPPYSRISDFIRKGYMEYKRGVSSVFLIPSRTDTRYWHEYIEGEAEVTFLKGRLKFEGAKNSAPFPSCLVKYINYG